MHQSFAASAGDFFPASGDLYDDNGVPGGHNFVCNWGPLLPGQSGPPCVQHVNLNISQAITNTATASGTFSMYFIGSRSALWCSSSVHHGDTEVGRTHISVIVSAAKQYRFF